MHASKALISILAIFLCFCFIVPAFAEIKVFEREVEEAVSSNQTKEQVEAFALQKAKRLAVEEAGTYISSLTVVQNYQLKKDEVTALASGVVQARIVGVPAVRVENGVVHVKVKARIDVDTSVLDRQVQAIMKEKGTLKKLEAEQRKVRDLEEKLANLKSSEVKRLEELNAQAIALERARDKQRLFREEQALRARGELSRAEAERIAKEREMQERINRTLAAQERAKREEAAALAAERDRVRRAQLENEQRWNELARKAKLSQESWTAIDDSLSLRQAMEETANLKSEIANLKKRLDLQYRENKTNLQNAYAQQISLTKPKMPPAPAPRDAFETTAAYNGRMADHEAKVRAANRDNEAAVEKLKAEENLKLAQAEVAYLEQTVKVLEPFVNRLETIQGRKFTLPEGAMAVELGFPDADHSRFPTTLTYKGKRWSVHWNYNDPDKARDFYKTRTYLKAEGLFQLEEGTGISHTLTAARVTHPGTKESREFKLAEPETFAEIKAFRESREQAAAAGRKQEKASKLHAVGSSSGVIKDPATGMEFVFIEGGCFQMGSNDGDSDERPVHTVCVSDFFIGKYEVTQGQWESVMGNNPSRFRNCGAACPVEQVSWNDVQDFIRRLNQKNGMNKYRLPTEAEWEYAARAGGQTKYCFGDDADDLGEYAWYDRNSGSRTHPVGRKKPNAWGLYDMHGNVWEWVQDWKGEYHAGRVSNPTGPQRGSSRVFRGGSWNSYAENCRSADRDRYDLDRPDLRYDHLGFRLVRTP
jgi:formylglycine-generating enzyme required for sulfatase activity